MPELIIVMPAYSVQASVRKVVLERFQEIENWTEDFVFLAIKDSSKDSTLPILKSLREQLEPRMEFLTMKIADMAKATCRAAGRPVKEEYPGSCRLIRTDNVIPSISSVYGFRSGRVWLEGF